MLGASPDSKRQYADSPSSATLLLQGALVWVQGQRRSGYGTKLKQNIALQELKLSHQGHVLIGIADSVHRAGAIPPR
jgi:hypothetical protein